MTPMTLPKDFESFKKGLKTEAAKNYVKYLEQKKVNLTFGPAINDGVGTYYSNSFAVVHVLGSVNSAVNKQVQTLDDQMNELINAKVINQDDIKKLEALIHEFARLQL